MRGAYGLRYSATDMGIMPVATMPGSHRRHLIAWAAEIQAKHHRIMYTLYEHRVQSECNQADSTGA
jgi:hypothetical protein